MDGYWIQSKAVFTLRSCASELTTIACNKEEMYGDLQFTNTGTGNKFKGRTKVYCFNAHEDVYPVDFIVGFCGVASDIVTAISYFSSPENYKRPPRIKGLSGLVLTAQKNIFMFDDYTKWLAVNGPYYAVGSGSAYAIGAMSLGASPEEAVRAAMKHDAYTGLGVKGFNIKTFN